MYNTFSRWPWRFDGYQIVDADGLTLSCLPRDDRYENQSVNGKLMAVAPELMSHITRIATRLGNLKAETGQSDPVLEQMVKEALESVSGTLKST